MDPHLLYEYARRRQEEIVAEIENDRRVKEALRTRPARVSKIRRWVGSTLVTAGLRILAAPSNPAYGTLNTVWRR